MMEPCTVSGNKFVAFEDILDSHINPIHYSLFQGVYSTEPPVVGLHKRMQTQCL